MHYNNLVNLASDNIQRRVGQGIDDFYSAETDSVDASDEVYDTTSIIEIVGVVHNATPTGSLDPILVNHPLQRRAVNAEGIITISTIDDQ